MLPQQPTGLVLVLLGDHLPALIAQQCHKQPTRRIPHPPRMHRGSHHVELGRLAALQPAAGDGVLVQGEQTGDIAQVGKDHVAQGRRWQPVGVRVQAGRGVWGTLGTYGGGEPGVGARRGSAVVTVAWEMAGPCMVCSVPARLYAAS